MSFRKRSISLGRRLIKGADQEDQESEGVLQTPKSKEVPKKVTNLNEELSYFFKKVDALTKGNNNEIDNIENNKEIIKIGSMAPKVFNDCNQSNHAQKELFKKKIIHSG